MSIQLRSTDRSVLMRQLNSLLQALKIPIPLRFPTDLTPSLLIAILESLLAVRIPHNVRADTPEIQNIQNTKIFLGVIETDVLKMDVGLSNLDPRKLADGGLEECIYIGELLCWVGRRLNFIVGEDPFEMDNEAPSVPYEHRSPSPSTTTRESFITSSFSMKNASESNTSLDSDVPPTPTPKSTPRRPTPRTRCIHEVPSPSVGSLPDLDASYTTQPGAFDSPSSSRKQIVRRTGYISPVDEELELLSFEQSRILSSRNTSISSDNVGTFNISGIYETTDKISMYTSQTETTVSLTALRESTARTLSLYEERARLTAEMARLESEILQLPR